jgi:Fe(3+) dicitrate transport protein
MQEVTVVGRGSKSDYQQIPETVGTNIYAGKKNVLIVLDGRSFFICLGAKF